MVNSLKNKSLDIQIYRLDFSGALLEDKNLTALENFMDFIERVHTEEKQSKETRFVLIQEQSLYDQSDDFLQELSSDYLLDTLFTRILRIQSTILQIRHSPFSWTFAFRGSCFGSFFEIALACQYRVAFDLKASVGFPQMKGQLFPYGCSFDIQKVREARTKKGWQQNPIMTVKEARKLGLINFLVDSSDIETDARAWVERYLNDTRVEPLPPVKDRFTPIDFKDEIQKQRFLTKAFSAIEKSKIFDQQNRASQWEFVWNLTKPKPRGFVDENSRIVICLIAAKCLLSKDFLGWLKKQTSREFAPKKNFVDHLNRRLFIDLNFVIPPTKCIVRLLEHGFIIGFYCDEAESLKEILSLLYARLEKLIPAMELKKYWTRQIFWMNGPLSHLESSATLRWTSDDQLLIQCETETLSATRLQGNTSTAECGWNEIDRSDENQNLQKVDKIAAIVSNGLIQTKSFLDGALRLSTFTRSVFLEELLEVSRRQTQGLPMVLTLLRNKGWGFIATDEFWEHFLRTRKSSFASKSNDNGSDILKLNESIWQFGIWKEARLYAKEPSPIRETWNPTYISYHFAMLSGLLTNLIIKRGLIDSRDAADIFVAECFDFPLALSTPLYFLDSLSPNKVAYYANKFWSTRFQSLAESLDK